MCDLLVVIVSSPDLTITRNCGEKSHLYQHRHHHLSEHIGLACTAASLPIYNIHITNVCLLHTVANMHLFNNFVFSFTPIDRCDLWRKRAINQYCYASLYNFDRIKMFHPKLLSLSYLHELGNLIFDPFFFSFFNSKFLVLDAALSFLLY